MKKDSSTPLSSNYILNNYNSNLLISHSKEEIINFSLTIFTSNNTDFLLVYKLYMTINLMIKEDSLKNFKFFLSEDYILNLENEKILYLLNNYKKLIIYFLSKNKIENFVYYSNDYFINFIKNNFNLLSNIYHRKENKTIEIISTETELDNKFKRVMNIPINEDKNNKMETEEENPLYQNSIRMTILEIYKLLLNCFKEFEIPTNSFLNFSIDLIDIMIKENNILLIKSARQILSYILKLFIIKAKDCKTDFPIRFIFKNIIKYLISSLLNNNSDYSDKYYDILSSIYGLLKNFKNYLLLFDLYTINIYLLKQTIYDNIDSVHFMNPLEIKNFKGFNNIDIRIIKNKYIIKLINLLDEESAKSFYFFIIMYLDEISKNQNYCNINDLISLIKYILKINWIPKEFEIYLDIISNNSNWMNIKEIVNNLILYLKTNKNSNTQIENDIKIKEKIILIHKKIILNNINLLH